MVRLTRVSCSGPGIRRVRSGKGFRYVDAAGTPVKVADKLGNTPAVCRSSYIDPRVIDLDDNGVTIARDLEVLGEDALHGSPAFQGAIEDAVLRLLRAPAEPVRLAG